MSLSNDLFKLVVPELCVSCGALLVKAEKIICLKCLYDLPRTRYDSYSDNPVARLFWGRVPVENASSYFRYEKGSSFQSLIHDLKYRDRKDIGRELGRLMGIEFRETAFEKTDLILPVPLHRFKKLQRGYNQCEPICEGLSGILNIPYLTGVLERPSRSYTQTNKSRFKRWENVEGIFRISDPESLADKHVLLVDDVVTTGSTLEACANAILAIDGCLVSIATLAVALKSY